MILLIRAAVTVNVILRGAGDLVPRKRDLTGGRRRRGQPRRLRRKDGEGFFRGAAVGGGHRDRIRTGGFAVAGPGQRVIRAFILPKTIVVHHRDVRLLRRAVIGLFGP